MGERVVAAQITENVRHMNSLATDTEVSKLQRAGFELHDIEVGYRLPTRLFIRAFILCAIAVPVFFGTGCYAYGGHALASNDVELRARACEANARNDRRAYGTLKGRLKNTSDAGDDLCGSAITVERTCDSGCDSESK